MKIYLWILVVIVMGGCMPSTHTYVLSRDLSGRVVGIGQGYIDDGKWINDGISVQFLSDGSQAEFTWVKGNPDGPYILRAPDGSIIEEQMITFSSPEK